MSLYALQTNPLLYKKDYLDYAKESQKIVKNAAERIQAAVLNRESLTDLFFSLIHTMAEERQRLAKKHSLEDAEQYGLRRDSSGVSSIACTAQFTEGNTPFDQRIISLMHEHLKPLRNAPLTPEKSSVEVAYPSCCDRKFVTQYEVIDPENKNSLTSKLTVEDYADMFTEGEIDLELGLPSAMEELLKNKAKLRKVKSHLPELYKKFKLSYCFKDIQTSNPHATIKNWILATNRIELDGKMVALSQYLTWTPDHFNRLASTMIIKQDALLIEFMLQKIAVVFEQAMRCHHNNLDQIKKHMALFKYLFIHAAPFIRGTSAISEWIEQAVYQYKTYDLKYYKDKMPSFEALTLSWPDFFTNYDTMYRFPDAAHPV